MTIQKTHQYKVFTPAGVYLGLLPDPSTPFNYNQNVLTTFAQLQITVPMSADVAQLANEAITDEASNIITDEAGNSLMTERQLDIVGSNNSNALIANNNLIQVWEYSSYYPNGLQVFSGYISKWKTTFGATDDIQITCLSQGTDMNNTPVTSGDTTIISNATDNGTTLNDDGSTHIIQTFAVGSAFQISAVNLEITAAAQTNLTVIIRQQVGTTPNPNVDPVITYGTVTVPIQTKVVTKISFISPTTLSPLYTYYIMTLGGVVTVFASNAQSYGAGNVYTVGTGTTYYLTPVLQASYSLYFVIYQHGGSVTGAYTNVDPSYMLNDIMNNYIAQGGKVVAPPSTIGALVSQTLGDTNIPGAFWSCAFAQVLTPTVNITIDTIQVKLPSGVSGINGGNGPPVIQLYTGNPALDSVVVTSGTGVYTLGGGNALVKTLSYSSNPTNSINGLSSLKLSASVTLTAGTNYYLVFFYTQALFINGLQGASTSDPTPTSPIGSLYSALVTANNTSAGMSKPAGVAAMYLVLGFDAGSSPNGGYSSTGTLATYTFKMQTVLQAIQAIVALAPANWYWYVDPATSVLNFAQANTVADFTIIRGRHINEIDIEATKENIKNVAYFSGGDDGTGTSTNILVKVTATQGSNRLGLALLSDNRVNSTTGGTVTAKLIAQNFLNNNSAETYISNTYIEDQTMDINLIKIGMMCGFAGFGNFVDGLLLQVVGVNRQPDQIVLQLGTLPRRDSQVVATLQAQLQAQQTVAVNSTPS